MTVLKWLRDVRCPVWESAGQEVCIAATHGTVEVLEWLKAAGKGRWDNAGLEELKRGSWGCVRGDGRARIGMQRRTPKPKVTKWLNSQLIPPPPPPLPSAESSGDESAESAEEESAESGVEVSSDSEDEDSSESEDE
eukprot:TRINITY_DN1743_c0_g1_i1.p2 TRINITY_DN1743_c0_g1~~TRINITY_DN1743_c0_g1_i1.p2  ORF type:complete len:137 (-),score=15.46 TRINITY_DN1743_c0_g1_i1:334-744(-)